MMARRQQRGMFLPAIVVLLIMGGFGWLLSRHSSAASRDLARESRTAAALAQAKDALLGFALIYRDSDHATADFGYLPCPDLDGDGSAETCGSQGQFSVGRLPYRTLNLPDLRDGYGECLWYAVAGSAKNNPKPVALNWDSLGEFQLQDERGAVIALPGDPKGQALALVIAAGPPLPQQYRSAGPSRCDNDTQIRQIQQYLESLTIERGNGPVGVASANSNDRLAVITTADIYRLLKRRPSYSAWLQQVLQASADCLSKSALPAPLAAESLGALQLGQFPALSRLSGACTTQSLRDAVGNWSEMMRYARCSDGSECLTGSSGKCRGVLLFGGERGPGQVRTTVPEKQNLANYLEAPTLAALRSGQLAGLAETIQIPSDGTTAASSDVALCLR